MKSIFFTRISDNITSHKNNKKHINTSRVYAVEPVIILYRKMKIYPTLSDEQRAIYDVIKSGNNCIVNACAGSGKSTTILSIARLLPYLNFIQLTYNTMLCKEVRDKVKEMCLENIQVMTFHSLAVKYYSNTGYTDREMRRVISENIEPRIRSQKVNILVIDEAQDMTRLYFKLLIKFCRDIGQNIQLFILGDHMQGLYGFKGSDIRYLTHADELWDNFELLKSRIFNKCSLTMSYRITNQMAGFINKVMIGDSSEEDNKQILACKEGEPVIYIRRYKQEGYRYIVNKIKELMKSGEEPSDFFILSSSVRNSVMKTLENHLVDNSVPCYVQTNEKIDERVIDKKVVFSSFHSVKGRQRKYVFIIGFDDTYFTYYGKTLDKNICPNTLYVAATRATHQLILFENQDERPLTFLKMSPPQIKNLPFVDYNGMIQTVYHDKPIFYNNNTGNKTKPLQIIATTPTDLIRFLPEEFYETFPNIEKMFSKSSNDDEFIDSALKIDIPNTIMTSGGGYEEVADLNGIAIPTMFFMRNKENILKEYAMSMLDDAHKSKKTPFNFLKRKIEELPDICCSPSDFLKSANVYKTITEKFYYKLRQIEDEDYCWLSQEVIDDCFTKMHRAFKPKKIDEITINNDLSLEEIREPINLLDIPVFINSNENEETGVYQFTRNMNLLNYNTIISEHDDNSQNKRLREETIYDTCEIEKEIINQCDESSHILIDDFVKKYAPEINATKKIRITARIDLIFENPVPVMWEIKCTTSIHIEHFLQVIIYAWILMKTIPHASSMQYKLFNIKTNEIYELNYAINVKQIDEIILYILKYKFGEQKEETENNDYFISYNKSFISKRYE